MRRKRVTAALLLIMSCAILPAPRVDAATAIITSECDARGYQWLAQTSPNITKAYVNTPWGGGGAVRCDRTEVTSFVTLYGTVTTYQQFGTTNYVYAPNSSGAYGNPGLNSNGACLAGPANPCSLEISVLENGNTASRSAV